MKRLIKGISPIILTMFGILTVIGGELDDSPGLGGIGIISIIVASYFNYKFIKE